MAQQVPQYRVQIHDSAQLFNNNLSSRGEKDHNERTISSLIEERGFTKRYEGIL